MDCMMRDKERGFNMLKTFNVVEKYEDILPYLDSKKNQSSFICELILKEMKGEQVTDLNEQLLSSSASLIQKEIRKNFREVLQEEIRLEIRSEFRDFKREFFESFTKIFEDAYNNNY